MDARDVVVIGGGLSGLCAATRAARAGARVTLLERARALGGRAASQVEHGFSLNQGPHALYLAGPAARTLRELGVTWSGAAPTPKYFFVESGGALHPMPSTTLGLLRTRLLGLADKVALARALSSRPSPELERTTASTWIERSVSGPGRGFLSALVRVSTYCADLDLLSAGAALRQLGLARAKGVLYVDGGWQTLTDGLARAATDAGVELATGAATSRLSREAGAWKIELAERDPVFATSVVLAAGPRTARALLPESRALARADESSVPVHAACLDVALSRLPNPHHHLTLGADRADYLSVHSAFARLGPEGGAVLHAARYLVGEEGAGQDAARVRGELEALLTRAQPGWELHVSCTRYLPRMIVSNALPLASRAGKRAPVAVSDAPSLFVCGDWVGDEGMLLDAALSSANDAATYARSAANQKAVA